MRGVGDVPGSIPAALFAEAALFAGTPLVARSGQSSGATLSHTVDALWHGKHMQAHFLPAT